MSTVQSNESEISKVKWHTDGFDLGLTLFAAVTLIGNPAFSLLVGGTDLVRVYNKIREAEDANEKALIDKFGQQMYEKGRQDQSKIDVKTARRVLKKKGY